MTATATPDGNWIRRFHPAPEAAHRLVFLPHAGSSASFFFPASRALSPALDVLAVQYPGRQDRYAEPCVGDLDEMADLVTAALLPWTDRPLAVFGHSYGATLGFEVARRLEDAGVVPLGLYASGRRSPADQRDEAVHLLGDDGLIKSMKLLAGDELEMPDEELLQMILPAVRADYKAVETYRYRPGPPLAAPIIALTGDADPRVSPAEAEQWAQHTSGGCAVRVFEGGHFYLVRHLPRILDQLRAELA